MTTWQHRTLPTDEAQQFGVLAGHVVAAEGTQHVFYVGGNDHVYEIWWNDSHPPQSGDLNSTAAPVFQPGCLSSHVFPIVDGTQHVFHISPERHVIELRWTGGEAAQPRDLTERSSGLTQVPLALSPLTSFAVEGDGTQHVVYIAFDQSGSRTDHLIELGWRGNDDPTARDLTELPPHSPFAAGTLSSHVFTDNTRHVFYNVSGHIWEIWWRDNDVPTSRDLTPIGSGAPLAVSPPASHVFPEEHTQHVFYTGEDGHVTELYWGDSNENPHVTDLTSRCPVAPPLPLSPLTSHVFASERTQHVYYLANGPSPPLVQSVTGRIIEIWWELGGGPQFEDLTERSGNSPLAIVPALNPPVSYVVDADDAHTQHVLYTASLPIIELHSEP